MFSSAGDGLAIRSRLHFSQSSQATPSQALSSALRDCNLADASQCTQPGGDICMTQGAGPPSQLPSQPVPSQAFNMGSQDFLTPAEQQFDTEPAVGGKKMRSPAKLTPQGKKRQRSSLPAAFAPGSQGLSQQHPGRTSRDLKHSPRCTHNVFADQTEPDAACSARRLPTVAMYREVFKELRLLGQGNFSRVFLARNRVDGMEYAIKRSKHEEVQALAAAGAHPNIVRYHAAWMEAQPGGGVHFYLQLERCGGSLGQRFNVDKRPLREAELLDILRQVAAALGHLHGRGIAHMDVKPDNIYGSEEGGLKLGDFGLATSLKGGRALGVEEGDSKYLPAEVMNGSYTRLDKADMFSLGATLYQLATGVDLPEGGEQYARLRQGKLTLIPGCSAGLQQMLARLMAKNPVDRPSPQEVLAGKLLNRPSNNPALSLLS